MPATIDCNARGDRQCIDIVILILDTAHHFEQNTNKSLRFDAARGIVRQVRDARPQCARLSSFAQNPARPPEIRPPPEIAAAVRRRELSPSNPLKSAHVRHDLIDPIETLKGAPR
jgi:hypothetical protein